MRDLLTVADARKRGKLNRSVPWWHHAIRLGKIVAMKIGGTYVIDEKELKRVEKNPPSVTRNEIKELYGK